MRTAGTCPRTSEVSMPNISKEGEGESMQTCPRLRTAGFEFET